MRKRRGHSLVECLITIGLIGVTLSILAVAMHQMRRSCRRVSEVSAAELELERFAAQLRSDAHRAVSVESVKADDAAASGGALLFGLEDETSVTYTLKATYVERLFRRGEEISQRETYRLPKSFAARWQVAEERPRPLVSLRLQPEPANDVDVPLGKRKMQIDAAVGLFLPLLSEKKS